ncbi:SDR family NAD(P)-dependent oxidoreductase [Modestobacter sp. I12A-02628]|uniref:SDR family NAD(P)-dependent oxidoreductase n=1 Tax=Goekera deserti TaxID=2497753 RepID=A0A7K3WFS5_9ACTN|nr:SDR family NAD(P)-dependent oxidoreductase [Goekera deserti]MPR00075.1 SDR family NAD(P)-dependent oxidoreductase [Goekera deserti]NDI49854.1 SDR family NAD(P)-dependent oxidoreductase [Goekera deserti]NEL55216.1 SDR family NAD(P)-dependent oxidoreductase [Goekera deserti]
MTEPTANTADNRPLALVTGASSGIGLEIAKQFAQRGYDLVVTAEDDELTTAAHDIPDVGAEIHPVQVDLRTHEGVEQLWAAVVTLGRPVGAAALNAGIGVGGPFVETELADEFSVIDLNVTANVHLAKLLLRDMVARDEGHLLITSSIAATMPGGNQSVYNASKSFLQSFAEALQAELEDSAVQVTTLMPGPVDTEFFERAGMTDTAMGTGPKDTPQAVAEQGVEALFAHRDKVLAASLAVKAQGMANRLLPDRLKAAANREGAAHRS